MNRLLWAITLAAGAVLVLVAAVWGAAAYRIADRLLGLYQGASGWRRGYLFAASLTGSWVVVRMLPAAARRMKEAARGHDRVSAVLEMAGLVPLVALAGLAVGTAAGLLWPVTVAVVAFRRRRDAAGRGDDAVDAAAAPSGGSGALPPSAGATGPAEARTRGASPGGP